MFKALDLRTNSVVALKRIPFTQEEEEGIPSTALREIAYLYELKEYKHHAIIELKDVHTQINPKGGVLHLVFECMDADLRTFMKQQSQLMIGSALK